MKSPVPAKRDQQINVRFTTPEIEALDRIARVEDRDRSYLIVFFTRWGIEQYQRIGSLLSLKSAKISLETRLVIEREMENRTQGRLKLREAARQHHDQQRSAQKDRNHVREAREG